MYVIVDDQIIEYTDSRGDGLALYVSETEMYDVTMELLKIIREAIISLSLCVNIAEKPKREDAKGKKVLSIPLMDYEDEWKT